MKEGVMVLSCISAPGNKNSFSARSWPLNGPFFTMVGFFTYRQEIVK